MKTVVIPFSKSDFGGTPSVILKGTGIGPGLYMILAAIKLTGASEETDVGGAQIATSLVAASLPAYPAVSGGGFAVITPYHVTAPEEMLGLNWDAPFAGDFTGEVAISYAPILIG